VTPPPDAAGALLVTVGVSTYQRSRLLQRLVAALAAQTLPPDRFELVVYDDASTDETAEVLERVKRTVPFSVRVLRGEHNLGQAAGRNRAWAAALAPIVAFTDDDCQPTPGWLEAGLAAMGTAPRVVVGRTVPHPDEVHRLLRPFSRSLRVESVKFFETCNIFYRRRDIESAGGFDESMRTGEDTELGLRVTSQGTEAVFASDALVFHEVRIGNFRGAVREARRWVDLPRVVRLHPEVRHKLLYRSWFWKRTHPPAVLASMALGLSFVDWRALLLLAPWLWVRLKLDPACAGPRRRWLALPGALAVDLVEVAVMVKGSVRHRTVLI
jgi:glycosyltransferase involved in cell wall biosynthesis